MSVSERDVVPDGFGPRVRWARKRKGMTQRDLEGCASFPGHGHVSLIEQGKTTPNVMLAGRIARCLGMSLDWLAAESDDEYRERKAKEGTT